MMLMMMVRLGRPKTLTLKNKLPLLPIAMSEVIIIRKVFIINIVIILFVHKAIIQTRQVTVGEKYQQGSL